MTSVYGVTFVGARAQILNRLEEKAKESDDSQLFPTSSYAAKVKAGKLFLYTCSLLCGNREVKIPMIVNCFQFHGLRLLICIAQQNSSLFFYLVFFLKRMLIFIMEEELLI